MSAAVRGIKFFSWAWITREAQIYERFSVSTNGFPSMKTTKNAFFILQNFPKGKKC
jgi:hypothetical protein